MHLCESCDSTYDRHEKGLVMLLCQSHLNVVVYGSSALCASRRVVAARSDYVYAGARLKSAQAAESFSIQVFGNELVSSIMSILPPDWSCLGLNLLLTQAG